MIGIELFDFQEDTVSYLLEKTNDRNSKRKIILKSPTGSGKTIILLSYIEQFLLNADPDMIFCWLTPGKGELEEQSEEKMKRHLPNLKTGDIDNLLLQGFVPGTTYFINWEMITNKKNNSVKETERKNLFDRIIEAHRKKQRFIVIIDEEHMNNTSKANDILNVLGHEKEIRVSATTRELPTAEFYEIPEVEVINSGLITRALYINEGVDIKELDNLDTEANYLIEKAGEKRKEIAREYRAIADSEKEQLPEEHRDTIKTINPLVIIQFPNTSERLIELVEKKLEAMGHTYDNGEVAKWLSDEKININDLTEDDAKSKFLLMKMAVSTGWDCPRAKVLVKLRENMDETFEIQTLGRLRRMPEAKHYDNELLDYCFLYTFDERYKESVLQSGNAYELRKLFLKEKCKTFTLKKELRNRDYQYVNEKEVLFKAYDFFKEKYKLTNDYKKNREILKNNGFIIGTKVLKQYRSGMFIMLSDLADKNKGDHSTLAYEVSTHMHGIECLHAVDIIKKVVSLQSNKSRAVLQHLFHEKIKSRKKLLKLTNREWYAFMINNAYPLLRDDFVELASKPNTQQMQVLQKHEVDFNIPVEDHYKYLPYEKQVEIYLTNAYEEYDTSMTVSSLRSISEKLFENYCEDNEDIDWVYKNGDSGKQYLSVVYGTNISKEYLFYPDYIVKKKNGEVWIIETKGGEIKGKSKNIDKQIENKFIAFKEYATKNSLKWGFVRDKDLTLYINNTTYTEDMSKECWVKLKDAF